MSSWQKFWDFLAADFILDRASIKASSLYKKGKLDEAEEWLRAVVARFPKAVLPRDQLACVLFEHRKMREALPLVQTLVELEPKKSQYWQYLGLAKFTLGETEEAIQAFETSLRINPTNYITLCNYGLVLGNLLRPQEAIAVLDRAVAHPQVDPKAFQGLITSYTVLGQIEKGVEVCSTGLAKWPENPFLLAYRMNLHAEANEYQKADQILQRLLKVEKDQTLLQVFACSCLSARRYQASADMWQKVLDIPAKYINFPIYLAVSLERQGRVSEMTDCLQEFLKEQEVMQKPSLEWGLALALLGHHEQAIEMSRCTEIPVDLPRYEESRNSHIAYSLEKQGRYEEFLAVTERSAERWPESIGWQLNFGNCYLHFGRHDEARAAFEKALSINRWETDAVLGLSCLEQALGNREAALEHIHKALAIEPSHRQSKDHLANLTKEFKS